MEGDEVIFAIDFDGTIVEHTFPEIGKEKPLAITTLKTLQQRGNQIIIWTCRCEPYLTPITLWLKERGFTPDAINSNVIPVTAFAVPKILADVYIDDKNFPPFAGWEEVRKVFLFT